MVLIWRSRKRVLVALPRKRGLGGFEEEKQIEFEEQHPSGKIVLICWRLRRIVSVALPRLQCWLIVKFYQDCATGLEGQREREIWLEIVERCNARNWVDNCKDLPQV